MLPATIKNKDTHTTRMADQVLSLNLFPDQIEKKPTTTSQVWKLYSKAKDNLQNGTRLENLSWRMMAMTLKKDHDISSESIHSGSEIIPTTATMAYETMDNYYYDNHLPNNVALSIDEILSIYYSTPMIPPTQNIKKPNLTECTNCQTRITPLWRRDPSGNALCNACGLFLKLHGVVRPLSLKKDFVKKRNRNNSKKSQSSINKRQKHGEPIVNHSSMPSSLGYNNDSFNNIPPELLPYFNNSFIEFPLNY